MLPPGLVDVVAEVDVKYDPLLRLRYAAGIQYAGRADRKGRAIDQTREGYVFGRKKLLLRQMQITVFDGIEAGIPSLFHLTRVHAHP